MSLAVNTYHDDPDDHAECKICRTEMEWVYCHECGGDGCFDCYDDDPINYAPDEEYENCQLCDGHGGWLQCPNAENHKEQPNEKAQA